MSKGNIKGDERKEESGEMAENLSVEDKIFDAEVTLLKVESSIESKNYLRAIELLFEFEKEGVLKDQSERLLDKIKSKGEFIEDGLKGQIYYKARKYEESLEYLENYLKKNPEDQKGWEFKAQIHEKYNNYSDAIEAYDRLGELSTNLSLYQKKAYCFYKLGNVKETIACLDYIIKREPGNKDASEFKKSCLRDYRTDGLKTGHFSKKAIENAENKKRNKIITILEVIFLLIIITGFSAYWLGKTGRALNGLNSDDMDSKVQSIVTLRGNSNVEVIDALVETLKDSNPGIRATAIRVLGETGNPEVVKHITPMLKDGDWSVRKIALGVLKDFKIANTAPEIAEVVKNEDEIDFVRIKALETLETVKSEDLSLLVPTLINDPCKKVRLYVIDYVERLSLKNHLPALEERFKKEMDPSISDAIAKAISKFKD